ncbi:sugar ABC transporter ATP-binding protein [Cryptosporangium arvum]|uniref:ABC-type sugar transport system, ATPase component n=1 Tax=Cryptosporangium arvum DSM 44712 TaxID=927661 RepID=A0A011AF42_9ACTN|nr:sugar ABC transporter ATP-binding protein [Cryptosporangium arvum]EXG80651.1 ABC-type sugar transport system, ATPase component [Cryptosporangium arvum DSM 44712]
MLVLDDVSKRFGGTTVLDHVTLRVRAGEVHGLVGQNGAGKSTLVKILSGLYPDHEGRITVDGRVAALSDPRASRAEGIGVIHQEFSLVPQLTVAENLLLGREPGRWGYRQRRTEARARTLLESVEVEIGAPLTARVAELGPAVRQRIEIVKALAADVRVLLLDEPTARLSEAERRSLFAVVRSLADRGVGMIFISHFLDEVREVTDQLTVLRNGRVVASAPTAALSVGQITALMVGDELRETLTAERAAHRADDARPVVLALRGTAADVELRAGEITAVAGLVGSGRTRLCRALSGAAPARLELRGRPTRFAGPRAAVAAGVVHIPEDRRHQGLCLSHSVMRNLALTALSRGLGRWGVVRRRPVRRLARGLVADLRISPADIDAPAGTLSGGNQQKVVLGKALAAAPDVLIVDQPTAGVDVGTKAQIHHLLRERADAGAAVLVVSDDIDELLALSDRFHVLTRGVLSWSGTRVSREELLAHISA